MYKIISLLMFTMLLQKISAQINYNEYPAYNGNDLGLSFSPTQSTFKIWSPVAATAELLLYKEGMGGTAYKTISLIKAADGIWLATVQENLKGAFYTFRVNINGTWSQEVIDPYAKAVGVNGKRAMVFDWNETNPANWQNDKSPAYTKNNATTDAIIYELQIRDASIHNSSGIINKGNFLGLAESNTKSKEGLSTGLQHIKELGVTHVHLLPFFDFNSIDETQLNKPQYNWGYDPVNYNAPEGSFSTDPYNGITRIKELKTMIAAFHNNGLRVVMDVVYNHTAFSKQSNFNQLVPGYYYRHKTDGNFSDATACGNETASDMPMMRKFMIESVVHWAKEYHIDGFRFDLMGVHDIETMNAIADTLRKIKPDILLYGEGWTAGSSPLPEDKRALKKNAAQLHNIAVFSDDIRDGIKGSVFEEKDRGFASGDASKTTSVKFGIVACCQHPQVDMGKVNYSKISYATAPSQVITYCECHDNNTLADKLKLSVTNATTDELKQMQKLALTIVLTSQGIPFLHAGTEFLRDKRGIENSYNKPDSINAIDWSLKKKNIDVFEYVQKLIAIRKQHPAFRLTSADAIRSNIQFLENMPDGVIAYTINGAAVNDSWKKILVIFNGNAHKQITNLPPGKWQKSISSATENSIAKNKLKLPKYSAAILYY